MSTTTTPAPAPAAAPSVAKSTTAKARGAFILFEGLDRSGKSTQCVKLYERLAAAGAATTPAAAAAADGKTSAAASSPAATTATATSTAATAPAAAAIHMRFPDRETAVGKMLDAYLRNATGTAGAALNDQTAHLLFAANRWENADRMRRALEAGQHVVVDRYSYSGVAYSNMKGLSLDWCMAPERGLVAPDLVIFMKLKPEDAQKRGGYGTERYEKKAVQDAVARSFDAIKAANAAAATAAAAAAGSAVQPPPKWVELDGGAGIAELHDAVWALATATIADVAHKPIATL